MTIVHQIEEVTRLEARIAGGLIAATPVPFDSEGRLHESAHDAYVRYMSTQPISGVAVWAHTGRGLLLDDETATRVLREWRAAFTDKLVVAGVGSSEQDHSIASRRTVEMAEKAARLGADALLVYAPTWLRDNPSSETLIVEYHQRLTEVGLPLILFYLYEAAGGISYSSEVLDQLLSLSNVVGIKVATLDSVMTYQDIARVVQEKHRDKLLITGEDRFLGYSLLRGAQAALIGMGAVCCELQHDLITAHIEGNAERFLELSESVDELAEVLFIKPMEGYIKRILWGLAHLGIIPAEAANDPWGPELDKSAFDRIGLVLDKLMAHA